MNGIAIQIPHLDGQQDIEVEVKINGVKQQHNYRIEIFPWEACNYSPEERAQCIRDLVDGYDNKWELAHIGMPTDDYIPITFRKKRGIAQA